MLILVTGGSGSGKSAFAEELIVQLHKEPYLYIATMYPFDEECRARIARHRRMRAEKHFRTLECYTGLKDAQIERGGSALLECMSNLTANEMYRQDGAGADTVRAVLDGVDHVKSRCVHLVIVSNEIFSDGIEYDEETKRYQRYLGEINRGLAERADVAVEVVHGIPVVHKGSLKGAPGI